MFDLFGAVKGSIKLPKLCIDDEVFRLHYKLTFVILFGSAILVTARQYLGDPIDCIVEEIPQNVMDTYCWIHSTFSIPGSDLGREGYDFAHPGVGPPINGQDKYDVAHPGVRPSPTELGDDDSFRYHKYYQWVALTLLFQTMLFYLPHYIWKYLEDGKMQLLAEGLAVPIVEEPTKDSRMRSLVDYLNRNKGKHTWYAYKFFLCEFLNLVNIVGQIFFTNLFLGGEFSKYGSEVISISEKDLSDRGDPMDRVFPKVAKCTFHKFGPSGTIEKFDGLCILPLNIINEKIYVFLWFYFIILSVITILHFVYRLAVIFSSSIRDSILCWQAGVCDQSDVRQLSKDFSDIGDWFLLHLLARNIDSFIFGEFVQKIVESKEYEQGEKCDKGKDNSKKDKHAHGHRGDFQTRQSLFKAPNHRNDVEYIPLLSSRESSEGEKIDKIIEIQNLKKEVYAERTHLAQTPPSLNPIDSANKSDVVTPSSVYSTESSATEDHSKQPSNEKSFGNADTPEPIKPTEMETIATTTLPETAEAEEKETAFATITSPEPTKPVEKVTAATEVENVDKRPDWEK